MPKRKKKEDLKRVFNFSEDPDLIKKIKILFMHIIDKNPKLMKDLCMIHKDTHSYFDPLGEYNLSLTKIIRFLFNKILNLEENEAYR